MTVLDTDHLTILKYTESAQCRALNDRMERSGETAFATTVVSMEEQLRGWLAQIHKVRDFHKQVPHYHQLARLFDFFRHWHLLAFDERAADECKRLRQEGIRIGTQDLKIASIALVHDALLLSANLADFRRVPGLRVESWMN